MVRRKLNLKKEQLIQQRTNKYPCHEDFIKSDTLAAKLFGLNDVESEAVLLLQSLGWTVQIDSNFNVFGLKRKGF